MKLLYYKDPLGNFGDDLNEWIWDRIAPGLIDGRGSGTMFGIGTLLQRYREKELPETGPIYVIGSGAGSKGELPTITDRWHIYGVRGPLTASYFGMSADIVCGDPAILIGKFSDLHAVSRRGVGFMPHFWSLEDWDWKATCERVGLIYIDPRADSKETVRQISGLEKLVTEAMHGAIVADAMRIPWVAVNISDRFEAPKWCDWAGSLGIDIHIKKMHQLRRPDVSILSRSRTAAKYLAIRAGRNVDRLTLPNSSQAEIAFAERLLHDISTSAEPQLSSLERLHSLVSRLEMSIARLVDDITGIGESPG